MSSLNSSNKKHGWAAVTAVILLSIVTYYFMQAVAQIGYGVFLTVSGLLGDGVRWNDLQLDMVHILERMQQDYALIASLYSVILIIVYLLYIRMRNQVRNYVSFDRPRTRHIVAGVAITLGMLGTANGLFILLLYLGEHNAGVQSLVDGYHQVVDSVFVLDGSLFWMILGICILVPIAEELLFRGIIQNELTQLVPQWAAILLQALLFSAFHMQPVQSLYVFLPGLAMGMVYAATRSLWVPILMHMVFNFFGSGVFLTLTEDYPAAHTALFLLQYAFILIGGLVLLWLMKKRPRAVPA